MATPADSLKAALQCAEQALHLIAAPRRADGTYNRNREACELVARDALATIQAMTVASPSLHQSAPPAGVFTVYTAGVCRGKPSGLAGWGAVVVPENEELIELSGFIGQSSPKITELLAVIEGLSITPEGSSIELVCTSSYVLRGLMELRRAWELSGFLTSNKKPDPNMNYWKSLYSLADARRLTTRLVPAGDSFINRGVQLANEAIDRLGE